MCIRDSIIFVPAIAPNERLPGFAFTSKLPIIRLQPLLPDTRPVAVTKVIKGRVLLSPGVTFEPLTSMIFHSPLIDDKGIAFSTERHEDIASAVPAMQIETSTSVSYTHLICQSDGKRLQFGFTICSRLFPNGLQEVYHKILQGGKSQ